MSQIKKSTGQQPDITPKLEPEEGRIQTDSSCEVSRTQPATLLASSIKQEPSVAPGGLSFATSDKARDVKEPTSPVQGPSGNGAAREDPSHRSFFQVYERAADIPYTPENALKEGTGMVKALQASINRIDLGSKMRQDVWRDEIADLLGQGTPTTMIAVCGATGAGKSSILNAILDDNIVPTSGMRACTAVVTEIGFHKKKTIDGDVSFLTEKEWRDELKVLLDDLVDEDGNLKRSTDLRSDAGVAWSKVHAVYPTISQEQLIKMTVDEIIARDGNIAKLLGTTKHMSAPDSKTFGEDISKYIDSKDQKRGEKKDKKKKEKDKEKAKERDDGPAYWPLIRQVRVWCNTNALSTGAILVDLPGVADANAARNNIAKDYMKKCNCVWVLAPITRAVDDKTARDLMGDAFKTQLMMDGNYDANAITFIATKCDDISCFEVIRALNLEDDPELELIEEEIGQAKVEIEEWGSKKADAEKAAKDVNSQLQDLRDIHQECEEHLLALQKGLPFQPTLSSKTQTFSVNTTASQSDTTSNRPKKRKRSGCESPPKKRMRGGDADAMAIDDDDFIVDDDLNFSDEDEDGDRNGSVKDSESDEDSDSDEVDAETEIATPESLKERIAQVKQAIKDGRVQLSVFKAQRKDAVDMLATLKKRQNEAQRRKNAFCSLKRSEFSRDVLKEDFRTGLKDLDDAEQEQKNPEKFDPTVNIRDYEAIDLPVFTCSARDYVRIKGQVKGDGDPTCFTKVEDTAIPALRQWCHQLTVSSRSRAAQSFLTHLTSFAKNVHVYLEGIGDVTDADRVAMREQWESNMADEQSDDDDMHASDDFRGLLEDLALEQFKELDAIHYKAKEEQKLDPDGEPVGITPRLTKEFEMVVDDCVAELQERFKDGLEEKCHVGALNAAAAAVGTSDGFASEMHWATYRATLRRLGTWRRDLNVELTNPFTRQIASSWSKVFEADLFASFQRATLQVIENLIADVVASAALGLKQRAKSQGELCLEEARGVLDKILDVVNETVNTQQKEVSRCLAPHVQAQLADGYHRAMEERGRGSVQRQKVLFHDYVDNIRTYVFDGAADIVMTRLSQAAEAVGDALQSSLDELSRKIEVSIAVLWEGVRDDPEQVRVREEVVNCVSEILRQLEMWKEVDKAPTLKRLG